MPIFIAILAIALVVGVVLLSKEASSPSETDTDTTNEITRPENNTSETEENSDGDENPSDTEVDTNTEIEINSETSTNNNPPTNSTGLSGTFTETAGYQTPAKTDLEIAVTLTLKDNVVTDADVVYDNSPSYSNQNQARFDQAFKTEVVGKNINEISLSRVGGASLTSGAFNEAVAKISQKSS